MMRKFYIFLGLQLFLVFLLNSQNPWNVATIKAELTKDANAVIRQNDYTFEVLSLSESAIKTHLVVTLYNKKGEAQFSNFQQFYGRYSKIKKIEGHIYNAKGDKVASLKKDQIYDMSTSEEAYEVSDVRTKIIVFENGKYEFPYTIEYICQTERTSGMFYPEWAPIETANVGVESTRFSVITPDNFTLRFKEFHIQHTMVENKNDKQKIYKWQLENSPPIEFEAYMPERELPYVCTAPTEFKVENFTGNASTWQGLGQFSYQMNQDRIALSADLQQKIKALVQNESDTLKRIQILYEWMQKRTRYISVQLGIGGWQTKPASEVEKKGIGDCKALSNFTVAVLNAAGIKANMALIKAGKNDLDLLEDFPNLDFNHMIVCVPRAKDSLWLECTSQTNAFAYLGSFTGNRKALLLTERGGYLVPTTHYNTSDNAQIQKVVLDITANGDAIANIKTVYKGIRSERVSAQIHQRDQLGQQKAIISNLEIPDFVLNKFSYQEQKSRIPEVVETLELKINKLCVMKSAAQFIKPNLFLTGFSKPETISERKFDFYLNPNYYDVKLLDTIVFKFPYTLDIENLPPLAESQTIFGTYSSKFLLQGNQILYCRHLEIAGGSFPKSEYSNWIAFLKFINKQDRSVAIVKMKTN